MSVLKDLIRWVTGANGRTEEVKQAEEDLVQRVKDETCINMDLSKGHFRSMKECYGTEACEVPEE